VIGVRLILAALVLLISAQSQGPPRDPSSATVAKPAGTGVIRGRVVAADTGVPIRRALVTISGGAPGRGTFQTIYTDAQGRSEVRDLAPGSYIVSTLSTLSTPAPAPSAPLGPLAPYLVSGMTRNDTGLPIAVNASPVTVPIVAV